MAGNMAAQPGNMGAVLVEEPPMEDPAQVLANMFKESDNCKDESQLRDWRQRVASHIRANMPQRFQIPALGDMQMRFENRLDVLHRAEANAKAAAEGKDVDAIVKLNADANTSENASHATSWMLVLAGLA